MTLPSNPSPSNDDFSWMSGGGEMGALIRSMDWASTPLGPPQQWPQSLRTSVSLCLSSTFPIMVAWGASDIQIYNDAYRPICGGLHPASMGAPFRETWASALPVVGDAFDSAHQGAGAYVQDQRMFLDRYGYREEAFMTFSFSPIRDESGDVGGIFHPITEATAAVLNARRSRCLRDLSAAIADARTIGAIGRHIEAQYRGGDEGADPGDDSGDDSGDEPGAVLDLPFMLLYQIDAASGQLLLRGGAGLESHAAMAPQVAAVDDTVWPFATSAASRAAQLVEGLATRLGAAPCGPYDNAPDAALVLPITVPGQQDLYGFVVAGVSAARALDAAYLHFYDLLGAAINTAVGNVVAYEKEQQRADDLAQIDRAKTAFFSNVSHEFRTPLTLILGPLDDALADGDSALAPAQRQRIEVTRRNALRLLKLVNSLLDFSRIEAGRVQAAYMPLDLARLTTDLTAVFESAMAKGGLGYHVELHALPQPVWVDRDMWEKIVFNLLSNAFKFTLQGAVSVTLREHGGMARLSVADTGSGIAGHELPRLFERFHRIEGAPGRTYEGTGIGLALIEELVRLHGGSISVHSVVGEGTRFDIDLPFGHGHLPAERLLEAPAADTALEDRTGAAFVEEALRWLPDSVPAAPPLQSAPAIAATARVLIADDNNDMRAYLASLLAPHAQVTACADGEAAVALLQAGEYDLLLSDVMMPRLDGFGLIARIRADARLQTLPVMLLSARAGEEAKIEGLQAGADDYMVKPFAANELLARVRRQVELGRERRQQQQALGLREAYFRSLIDLAPVMLWTTDASGACTYLSQRWCDYTGRTAAEDLGFGWFDNLHADDIVEARRMFMAANAAQQAFSIDYRLRRGDGSYAWFVDAGNPRFDEEGRFAGFVGTVADIHARTTLQHRLEQVARAGDIGVWYADAPFRHYQINEQMAGHLGLGAARAVSLAALLAALAPADQARLHHAIDTAQQGGAALDLEFYNAREARWLRAIGWCDLDEQGQTMRFDGVTFDISPHKHATGELQRLADALAEKNRMQSEFLFTLAHELRNPLAPIRSGLDLMRLRPAAQGNIEVQAMMRRQVDHMVHLVDDLLDMARLSEGKVELRLEPVTLAQVIADAIEISVPLIEAGHHQLAQHLPATPVLLAVDRHRIAQVLSNLLNNAAKYTPPHGRIRIDAAIEDGSIVVAVSDNGIGIDAAMLPLVFDMYAQAHRHQGVGIGGLGVGLNLVRRLVELHGGTVQVESAGAGQGSRFTVRLPLDGASAPAGLPLAVVADAPGAPADSAALRVLVVDDNVDAADMLAELLQMHGHTVRMVHDGAAAIALAAHFLPQVVFLDIGLPDQSGFEVAPRLRQLAGMAQTTLVALTGWGAEQDRQRSQAAGFDRHLTKPADLASVEQILKQAASVAQMHAWGVQGRAP